MVYMRIRTGFRNGVRRLRNRDKMQGWSETEEDKVQMFFDCCEENCLYDGRVA